VFTSLIGKVRIFAFVTLAYASVPLAHTEVLPLTNSRLASFFCGANCFPTDSFQINVTVKTGPHVPAGLYQVGIGGVGYSFFSVNGDGTVAGPDDPLDPYSRTIVYGPSGNLGNLDVTIYNVTTPTTILYQHSITVTGTFVWDFFWTFLGIPATFSYHTPINYPLSLTAYLEPGHPDPNPNLQPPTPSQPTPNALPGNDGGGNPPPSPSLPLPPGTSGPPPQTPQGSPPNPPPGGCPIGMPVYSFTRMSASLTLTDTPLSYTPPRGPAIPFTITYNQLDPTQSAAFTSSNLGPGWTFNWLTYITGGPATGQAHVTRYVPGGGTEEHQGYTLESLNPYGAPNGRVLRFDPQLTNRSVMRAVASPASVLPDTYQRTLVDGTVEYYENNAGGGSILYLTKIVDFKGNTVTINYAPSSAQIVSIIDALGQQTTFTYGLVGDGLKITQVTDPFGKSASFTYDAQGRLASVTDALGLTTTFAYQGATTFVSSMTTPYGTTSFTFQQGSGFAILESTDPLGQKQRVEYQASLASIPATETRVPTGPTINNSNLNQFNSFFWDAKAYADAVTGGAAPGTSGSYAYAEASHWPTGPSGLLVPFASSQKKPLEGRVWVNYQGQARPDQIGPTGTTLPSAVARVLDNNSTELIQYLYNAVGNATQIIDPLGRQTNYFYSIDGIDKLQATQKNGGGSDTLFSATYNTQHSPLTVTDAAGQTATYTYNVQDQMLTVTNAKSETTTMAYDPNGYLLTVTGAIPGSTTTYTYDPSGRIKTVADSESYIVGATYDSLNRPLKQTFPDGTFRQTVYDRLSLGSTTDRLGRTTTYTNDALGRTISIKDPLNRISTLTWCKCGALQTLQDGKGNVTTWIRDTQGRVTTKKYADNSTINYVYESSTSRLKSSTDALGQTTGYLYNADDNPASKTYSNAKNLTPNVSFGYDPVYNRRTSMIDGTGTTVYAYNPVTGSIGAGLLATVTGPLANSTITYTYDPLGRGVGRSINGVANQTGVVYDALGRVTSETNGLGAFSTNYVNQTARPSSLTYPNGQSMVYQYFNNLGDQRLQEIKNLNGASVLSQFDYTYDTEGQILSWAQQTGAANTYALGYDLAGQLTGANRTGGSPQSFGYAYDPAGNRTNETIGGSGAPVMVNNLNELVSRTGSNARSFAYDADGNLLSNNGASRSSTNYTFQWDAENRLIAINYPTTNQQTLLTYDGLGRRVKIVEKTGATITSTKQFVWDGLSVAEERDGSGNLTKRFYPEGQINGATALFYARDHLGSIREVVNGLGILQARYEYDPYGRRTLTSGTDIVDFGFTGHYYHGLSKLYLAPYRAFDADAGKWLSRDPQPDAFVDNLYTYSISDPISLIDPLGLWQVTITAGGLAGLAGQITFGNNGGCGLFSGLINGQWNAGFKVGVGVGASIDLDIHNTGRTPGGWLPEVIASGEVGAISRLQGQVIMNDSMTPVTASLTGGLPGTPLYANANLDLITMHPTAYLGGTKGSIGASGFVGGGGTFFFSH
jgi:RHS repeat-associated protein